MDNRVTILAAIIGGYGIASTSAGDTGRNPYRLSLGGRFTFGVDADFTSATPTLDLGPAGAIATTPAMAATILRNYDDGFIGVDVSGNAGDTTTFWGYADASQIAGLGTPGGTLSFHSAPSPADQFGLEADEEVLPGFDFEFSRDLGSFDLRVNGQATRAWYGFTMAFGYLDLKLAQQGAVTAPVALTTDTFAIGAVIPPVAPYQGTVPGPGPLIPDSPTTRVTAATPATAAVQNEIEGNMYGLTVGPFLEIPFGERLIAEFSGGLAVAVADRSYTFSEAVTIAGVPTTVRAGAGDSVDWLIGGVASLGLNYRFAKHTDLRLGLQYQNLGSTSQSVSGKTAGIDLQNALSVSIGLGWRF